MEKSPSDSQIQDFKNSKKRYWKFVFGFLGIIVIIGGGFFVWDKYFSPQAKINRETQKNYEKYLAWEKNYEKAMAEDTYGGKTPEETLQMFIEALKNEDIELASKYFVLRSDGSVDPKREEVLKKAKEARKMSEIISILSEAKPDLQARINKEHYVFSTRDKKGTVITDIDLQFNKYSDIWKIESL